MTDESIYIEINKKCRELMNMFGIDPEHYCHCRTDLSFKSEFGKFFIVERTGIKGGEINFKAYVKDDCVVVDEMNINYKRS